MKRLIRLLGRQHNSGPLLGAVKSQFQGAQFYVGLVQFLLIVAVAYNTTLREPLQKWFPWIDFGLFLLLGTVGYLLIMLLDYKYILPSSISFGNQQGYLHDNPIRKDIKDLADRLERLEKNSEC